jgi:hypothetical protein
MTPVSVQTREPLAGDELDRILAAGPAADSALVPVAPAPAAPAIDFGAILAELGIAPLGVLDEPMAPARITVDGQPWRLAPVAPGTVCRVPPSVAGRAARAQALGIDFDYWLAEELPKPLRRRATTPRPRAYDPILFGVLALGDGRCLVCSLGAWDHPAPALASR